MVMKFINMIVLWNMDYMGETSYFQQFIIVCTPLILGGEQKQISAFPIFRFRTYQTKDCPSMWEYWYNLLTDLYIF